MKPNIDISPERMTPAQQKRLADLMTRDLNLNRSITGDLRSSTYTIQHNGQAYVGQGMLPPAIMPTQYPCVNGKSIDDMLDQLENAQNERAERAEREHQERIDKMFNREELFRFAYVPFVIAELVWDYADTVIIMAKSLNNPATRRLSRAIRNARTDYDRLRHQYIDHEHRERELENGYVFEDAIKRITAQMLLNVRIDINSEYPALNDDSRDLLLAVYQCHIMSKALLRYLDKQSERIVKRVGHPIGKMLPPSYYVMDKLIPEFIGDKPASAHFKKLMSEYISTLAVQMALVELNDITDNQK